MILYRELSWWYWAVTAVLSVIGLADRFRGVLSGRCAERRADSPFPFWGRRLCSVPRAGARGLHRHTATGLWTPMDWLFWVPAIGTLRTGIVQLLPAGSLSLTAALEPGEAFS